MLNFKLKQGTAVPLAAVAIIALLWIPSMRAHPPAIFSHDQTTPTVAKHVQQDTVRPVAKPPGPRPAQREPEEVKKPVVAEKPTPVEKPAPVVASGETADSGSWSGVVAFWLVIIGLAQTAVGVMQYLAFRKQARFMKRQSNFMRDVLAEMETRTVALANLAKAATNTKDAPVAKKMPRKKSAA